PCPHPVPTRGRIVGQEPAYSFTSKDLHRDFDWAGRLPASSGPSRTDVGSLSDPLQNGFVTTLSAELSVTLIVTKSARSVFTMHIGELSTAISSLSSQRRTSRLLRFTEA